MSAINHWTILGDNPLADDLRRAAAFQPAPQPLAIITEGSNAPPDAFVLGPAVFLTASERFVPWYAAFEAIEEVKRAIEAGELGRRFGCFTSYRLPRGQAGEAVIHNGLFPAVALTLDLLAGDVTRVWARHAALFDDQDAWFVTLRFADDTIATIEALSATDPAQGPELLVEITGSDMVLRAEPLRQAVMIEPVGGAPAAQPWWEDVAERYLQLLMRRAEQPHGSAGSRFRDVWRAIQRSAESGEPVTMP